MGGIVSSPDENNVRAEGVVEANPNLSSTPSKKRSRSSYDIIDVEDGGNVTPRKKMKTTSEYIYKTLFLNGENSDVTIKALEQEWHLHKIYLCQSPYFRSMFKGDWLEKGKNNIAILTPDELINTKALEIAFGSLYSYEVDVDILNNNLIPVLAASRMFQLDGLLQHCEESMLETISPDTVCKYHEASARYGLPLVESKCFSWLERNLLLCRTPSLAKNLPEYLLKDLLLSPNLVVMQVEMDVYNFMKIWLYLQLNVDHDLSLKKLVAEAQKYYQDQKHLSSVSLLETEIASRYVDIFKCLRLENMIGDIKSINLLDKDNLIPKDWLMPLYEKQWLRMLSVYTGDDNGPTDVDDEAFERHSCRCGRVLESDNRYCWRWTGFSYGIDVIVTYNNRTRSLSVKRNTFSQPCNFAVCMQGQRSVVLRFKVFTLKASGEEDLCKDTGVMHWNFRTDEEIPLLELDDNWQFPIYISARLQLASVIPDGPS